MSEKNNLGGRFTFAGTNLSVNRMGYGAMQLAGPHVWGPPKDVDAAVAVLREAMSSGVNHIDTSDFYGPHVTNQIIKKAIHPYAKDLVIVTKVGNRRAADQSWPQARSRKELTEAIHDNLKNLGLDAIDVVNLRVGAMAAPLEENISEPLQVLVDLKKAGLIKHIGLSNVSTAQLTDALKMTEIVCVQNYYNLAHRIDDALVEFTAAKGIAYVPFFPLGGFTPLQSSDLENAAKKMEVTPMQLALAWLLQRSPNILLIPGTSSVGHLKENLEAAALKIPADILAGLNSIASNSSH